MPQTEKFFKDWLRQHGHDDIVVDRRGVGIAGNATRLHGSFYGSKNEDGFIVETEFRILLPSGEEVIEFLAGTGETEEQAIQDTLLNFMTTTFHVIYKGFMNPDDDHMKALAVKIAGQERRVIFGDILARSGEEPVDFTGMNDQIERAISQLTIGSGEHWVKIVYGRVGGEVISASASLDNKEDVALSQRIKGLAWPGTEGFYIAKQFILIQ
ncbi:MAG: DUF6348 family protein [Planctomycetota bacterium]